MAYSIFATIDKIILNNLEGPQGYLYRMFDERPWLTVPDEQGMLHIWIKPRYSVRRLSHVQPFLDALKYCESLGVLEEISDCHPCEITNMLIKMYGLDEYFIKGY